MSSIFHTIIYQPLYNALIFLYNVIPGHDFGIAIIVFTILLKMALIPISKKQIESQKKLQELQPQIKEIQTKYKNDKERQTKEMLGFYKKNKTNPFSGCLPLIFQLIFFIAIYRVLINISNANLTVQGEFLYSFVKNPENINNIFIGVVDLAKPSIPIAVLAAIAQFFQAKTMTVKKEKEANNKKQEEKSVNNKQADFSQIMNKQMMYLGPFLTLFIGIKFASGLALYWLVSTLFALIQQIYIIKKNNK